MEEISALLTRIHAGDKEARKILIEENLGLVRLVVGRFSGREDPEDLFQIGTIGLMKAIDRFDPAYDVQFSTYAVPLIMGEIKRFLRDDGMIKISRSIKENLYRIKRFMREYEAIEGKEATLETVAKMTGIAKEDVLLALEADRVPKSMEEALPGEDGSEVSLAERLAPAQGYGQACEAQGFGKDPEKEAVLNHLLIEQLLKSLNETERRLVLYRFYEERTQTEVARAMGVSQVSVSRMEKKILQNMRKRVSMQ